MPKKKKTRKQKALTDVRRQTEPKDIQTATFETKPQTREEKDGAPKIAIPQPVRPTTYRNIITTDYHYLAGDLRKTLFLSGAIVILEIALKFGTGI
jgi:hypothetical protein